MTQANIQQNLSQSSNFQQFHSYVHRPTLQSVQQKFGIGTAASANRFALGLADTLPRVLVQRLVQKPLTEEEILYLMRSVEVEQLPEAFEPEQLPEEEPDVVDLEAFEPEQLAEEEPDDYETMEAPDIEERDVIEWKRPYLRRIQAKEPQFGVGPTTARILLATALLERFLPIQTEREWFLTVHATYDPTHPAAYQCVALEWAVIFALAALVPPPQLE